jgi:methylamine dehydrogenase accessory protein MauD
MDSVLVTSHALLWVAVIVEGVVIIALLRQVGSLLIRVGSVRGLDAGYGPPVGQPAPWLPEFWSSDGSKALLLVFLSTECGTRDALVPAVNSVSRAYSDILDVVSVFSSPKEEVRTWVRDRGLKVPHVRAPEASEAFAIGGTPYAFVVDKRAEIAARGGVNHIEHLESLIRQCHIMSSSEDHNEVALTEERTVIRVVEHP